MKNWFVENLNFIIITIILPLIGWFGSKKYFQDRELKSKDIENDSGISEVLHKNLNLYQRMLDDIEERYEDKLAKRDIDIENLENKVESLDTEIILLEEEISDLETKISKLKAKIKKLDNNV